MLFHLVCLEFNSTWASVDLLWYILCFASCSLVSALTLQLCDPLDPGRRGPALPGFIGLLWPSSSCTLPTGGSLGPGALPSQSPLWVPGPWKSCPWTLLLGPTQASYPQSILWSAVQGQECGQSLGLCLLQCRMKAEMERDEGVGRGASLAHPPLTVPVF